MIVRNGAVSVPTVRSDQRVDAAPLRDASPRISLVYGSRRSARFARRVLDLLVAVVALAVTAPLLLVAAGAIVAEDRGPVLFTQKRVGRFERLFTIYKLRTMRVEMCDDRLTPSTSRDARLTRVGRLLRRTSIDELPQLINVIRGEMSLIGPRPEMPFIVREYAPWQHLRHLAAPGLTGLWQVTCRSQIPLHWPEATLLDLEYIRRASPSTDLKILLETVRVVVNGQGAH
ncbi:MAG: sugar transferase [Vulcanimicrobiaceae bacterium]|jgi:lipopolysaccharide/colanic/teichoic acid biosynthesis glycosyltransferase